MKKIYLILNKKTVLNELIKQDGFYFVCELLPLVEERASWEVSVFTSQIYLPSSSGSPCPDYEYYTI